MSRAARLQDTFRDQFPLAMFLFDSLESGLTVAEAIKLLPIIEGNIDNMPQPIQFTARTRPTKDLHADWWNPKRTTDGHLNSPEAATDEPGRYVERVTIFADMFGADTQAMQTRLFTRVDLSRVSEAKSAAELARQRFYLFQRMVTEITNENGDVVPLDETFMTKTYERDLAYIEQEINDLKKSPIPVTHDDVEKANKEADQYDKKIATGVPPEQLRSPRMPETIALDDFRQ